MLEDGLGLGLGFGLELGLGLELGHVNRWGQVDKH